ncbi:MAG: folate-binding protein YgfZ [Proteobacteria bacterium]|nr:folate-binding protein YgfZ [Pseudomonadota bacterium]
MPSEKIAHLADRGVVSVTGRDSEKLLQGLVTNDLDALTEGEARHAALLSPQGKILFDFFVVRHGADYLLDVARSKAGDLVKRLTMYKLRADVAITDVSATYEVYAIWGGESATLFKERGIAYVDPRHPSLGLRLLARSEISHPIRSRDPSDSLAAYDALRVRLGVPEGGKDYALGDTYPHEANFDLLNGVSFGKGCYVGQEIVARMQNKTIVRKRAIKVSGVAPLTPDTDVLLGDVAIGHVGTVDGNSAIAMLRLDRAIEAQEKGQAITAAGVIVIPDVDALNRYRVSAAARASTVHPSS